MAKRVLPLRNGLTLTHVGEPSLASIGTFFLESAEYCKVVKAMKRPKGLPGRPEPFEMHERSEHFKDVPTPVPTVGDDLAIFDMPVDTLLTSKAYPYGLSTLRIERLQNAGFLTVRDLASASDQALDDVESIGEKYVQRIRAVLGQAIWM